MSRTAVEIGPAERYFDAERAVGYVRSRGFLNVRENTLKHAAYKTRKLAKPKVLDLVAHWAKSDLDAWIDRL